jgi:hypothetical protein
MKLTIKIDGGNAAFYNDDETINSTEYQRILAHLVRVLPHHINTPQAVELRDINGDKCGSVTIEKETT